jgi:hypothetical protein
MYVYIFSSPHNDVTIVNLIHLLYFSYSSITPLTATELLLWLLLYNGKTAATHIVEVITLILSEFLNQSS